jgi:hypothetical protein
MLKMITVLMLTLLVFGQVLNGIAEAEPSETAVDSQLLFESSDHKLEQAFKWAKAQALHYAHEGEDPVGPWYEAALPGRRAFCMRDVAHQVIGAAALGLDAGNLNMLSRFASAVSPARDWAGYWEIDVTGNASPEDYLNDHDFWYNLPANFDILDAAVRLWAWTADNTYLTDSRFTAFFEATAGPYVKSWGLQSDNILSRPRIMNALFNYARGIPSYNEGPEGFDAAAFNVGVDLLAAEYRAFTDLAFLAGRRHDLQAQHKYLQTAAALSDLIETKAWSEKDQRYYGFLRPDGTAGGSGDMWLLRFDAISDPVRIRGALSYLESPQVLQAMNVEGESYLPRIFFLNGENASAYQQIFSLSNPAQQRRDYPEVSFAVIDALVTGVMGVEGQPLLEESQPMIRTLSRLLTDADKASIQGVRIQGATVDITHIGEHQTSFTNRSNKPLRWQAEFPSSHRMLYAEGKWVRASLQYHPIGKPTSSIVLVVPPGATRTVSVRSPQIVTQLMRPHKLVVSHGKDRIGRRHVGTLRSLGRSRVETGIWCNVSGAPDTGLNRIDNCGSANVKRLSNGVPLSRLQ